MRTREMYVKLPRSLKLGYTKRKADDADQVPAVQSSYGLKKLADGVNPTFECAS
jgi:hypothetical protein